MDLTKSIIITAQIEAVFAYLADFRRHEEWNGDADLAITQVSPGDVGVGFTYERQGKRNISSGEGSSGIHLVTKEVTITEYIRNERLAFKVTEKAKGVEWWNKINKSDSKELISFEVAPAVVCTQILLTVGSFFPWWIVPMFLFERIFRWIGVSRTLKRIKAQVEQVE